MRKLLFPAIAAAFAATTLITTAVADPLWSWGDDEWGYDGWSYRDWAYRPSGHSGWGYHGREYSRWGSGAVIAPYAYYPAARYHYVNYGYNLYAAYPVYYGYHFGFWGACGC
ncbi:MAG TPA: hypothetical protein VGG64_05095 [Pirellulales bacterium]|jgi:hypothetical protein